MIYHGNSFGGIPDKDTHGHNAPVDGVKEAKYKGFQVPVEVVEVLSEQQVIEFIRRDSHDLFKSASFEIVKVQVVFSIDLAFDVFV